MYRALMVSVNFKLYLNTIKLVSLKQSILKNCQLKTLLVEKFKYNSIKSFHFLKPNQVQKDENMN